MPISIRPVIAPLGQPIPSKAATYNMLGSNSGTSASLGAGTLRAAPIYVPRLVTLDRIGAEITATTDATAVFRIGIYSDNGNLYPGNLLLDAGTIAADVASGAAVREITISQILTPGVYWLAGVIQVVAVTAPTVRTALEFPFCPLGDVNTLIASDLVGVRSVVAAVTGALPSTFDTSKLSSTLQPRIFVRAV